MKPFLRTCGSAASSALFAGIAIAQSQCGHVAQPGPAAPGPIGGAVRFALPWDPDGAGPQPELVVLGGSFTMAGRLAVGNVVAYDPAQREFVAPLAPLADEPRCGCVMANGDLVIATHTGRVVRWTGSAWQDLGAPIAGHFTLTGLANGDLIAGGFLGLGPSGLLRFDGVSWQPMATLTAPAPGPTMVLASIRLDNGDLVVTGNFDGVAGVPTTALARWNGTAWSAYPGIAVTRGEDLLALPGGRFLVSGTLSVGGSANTVARWDGGSWTTFPPAPTTQSGKLALRSNGDIVQTRGDGVFDVWNGTAWTSHQAPAHARDVLGLAGGDVLACGDADPTPPHVHAQRWDGGNWHHLADGLDGHAEKVLALPDGRTAIAGRFAHIEGVAANHVAVSTATGWAPLGAGLPGRVLQLASLANGDLVAAIHSSAPDCIQRWDGQAWSPLGPGTWQAHEAATAMLLRRDGTLVVATTAWPGNGLQLRTWDGTAWTTTPLAFTGGASALAELPNRDLVVAGIVLPSQRPFVSRVVGNTLVPFGAPDRPVACLRVLAGGDLLVAGSFDSISGVAAPRLARFAGATWHAMAGAGGYFTGVVELPNGDLVASGRFASAGSYHAAARWTSGTWAPLGASVGHFAAATDLAFTAAGELTIAGSFALPGSGLSFGVTRFRPSCVATAGVHAPGCASTAGPLATTVAQYPWLGATCVTRTANVPAHAVALGVTGFSAAGIPLAQLLPQALPGCSLHVTPASWSLAAPAGGVVTTSLAIPAAAALLGQTFRQQVVVLEFAAGGALAAAASSDALLLGIGAL